jgi:hypothetical protein
VCSSLGWTQIRCDGFALDAAPGQEPTKNEPNNRRSEAGKMSDSMQAYTNPQMGRRHITPQTKSEEAPRIAVVDYQTTYQRSHTERQTITRANAGTLAHARAAGSRSEVPFIVAQSGTTAGDFTPTQLMAYRNPKHVTTREGTAITKIQQPKPKPFTPVPLQQQSMHCR